MVVRCFCDLRSVRNGLYTCQEGCGLRALARTDQTDAILPVFCHKEIRSCKVPSPEASSPTEPFVETKKRRKSYAVGLARGKPEAHIRTGRPHLCNLLDGSDRISQQSGPQMRDHRETLFAVTLVSAQVASE
ncbi:hypothetical protein ZHAS_00018962 [Anopheles sinensis]|uniref:Uncharacterized protein n=1 Tax=Anopheles sinensis TaxID=74873 RepID=A0A084WL31_ANOSI|nr:hypothetical protein ZHAS_00018962 [Anopheles sinensis]